MIEWLLLIKDDNCGSNSSDMVINRKVLFFPVEKTEASSNFAISFESVFNENNDLTCKIEVLSPNTIDISEYVHCSNKSVFGLLGIIRVKNEDFIGIITSVVESSTISDKKFYCIRSIEFISIKSCKYDDTLSNPMEITHPCYSIINLFSKNTFYFICGGDATKAIQKITKQSTFSWKDCEKSFFWNRFLLKPVHRYAKSLKTSRSRFIYSSGIFAVCFQGSVAYRTVNVGNIPVSISLISRTSCRRAGTRFRSRGIDDDGNVSNFVETEIVMEYAQDLFSYIIIRGTVPVFWDQQGYQFGFPKIQLTRSPAATQPSFDRHINHLINSYGLVHSVNLLSQKEGQAEHVLSTALELHVQKFPERSSLSYTRFDLYSVCKNGNFENLEQLFQMIGKDVFTFGYFFSHNGMIEKKQEGIFRVNCLDCLDRTNKVQNYIVKRTTDFFLRNRAILSKTSLIDSTIDALFLTNGDKISQAYTGSGSIKSSYGRLARSSFYSLIDDMYNTTQRFFSNNFAEKSKQSAIDTLLGKSNDQSAVILNSLASDAVELELKNRLSEYSSTQPIQVQLLTWNTNNCMPEKSEDYSSIISQPNSITLNDKIPHIFVVGFQEVVKLNATQIMTADAERRRLWEDTILDELEKNYPKHSFSKLVSHQLVGTSLSIFVRTNQMESIKHVEISSIKTGLGGMTGNKGSVAIRMEYFESSLCFVCSHFSAGKSYLMARNNDMKFAFNEIEMSNQKKISSHDIVFWIGDMNYRIDLSREEVLASISANDFTKLRTHDQLFNQMQMGNVFEDFVEPEINFLPTYKYDRGTNIYDTSEKMRVPSWTDRILYCGEQVENIFYSRVEIDVSDHKPVKSLFQVNVLKIDQEKYEALRTSIVNAQTKFAQRKEMLSDADSLFNDYSFLSISDSENEEDCHSTTNVNDAPLVPPRPKLK